MKVAALLALLAAMPAHASDAVTPAQARANVVASFPREIRDGVGNTDLRTYLQRLTPEQKQAALRSLTAKEGELGDDPTTLGVLGEAYAGLGKVQEAKEAAQAILRQNPNHPEAKRLMGWVTSQEKLAERGSGGGPFGDRGGPGSGGQSPAAAGSRQATLNALEQRIARAFQRGQRSAEFRDTMEDARGMSVAELKEEGIVFQRAAPDQKDAVMITQTATGFTVALRDDALASGGDTEARAAAHVANGVRQAQTYRDHSGPVAWALVKARGWMSGAQTHKELAPNDIDRRPTTPSDQNLMASRRILDQKTEKFDKTTESYGEQENGALAMFNTLANVYGVDVLMERFLKMTGRAN